MPSDLEVTVPKHDAHGVVKRLIEKRYGTVRQYMASFVDWLLLVEWAV